MKAKEFPTLYAKSSAGKLKVWRIWVEDGKPCPTIITEYGQYEGKHQQTIVKVPEGKNIGRSNETTPLEQAIAEAASKWQKQQDRKKYTTDPSGESDQLLPMLAHNFKKMSHHIEWPAYVQPKLNGVRCLASRVDKKRVVYTSRGGKEFTTLDHLTPSILRVLPVGGTLDGELFTEELTFQEIVSAIKRAKTKNPDIEKVQYWVYDLVLPEEPFETRTTLLGEMIEHGEPIVFVDTGLVWDEEAMMKAHQLHVADGFEGTIIRNKKGVYRRDFRSKDLQKHKDFIDEEFEIVGGKEGIGRAEGTITWTCVTEEGKEFDVRPTGSQEQRALWWKNLNKYIGKKLTVRYQNRSDDNIPIFPVGVSIREGKTDKDGNFKPDF